MRVGNSYPVCKEAAAILPAGYAPKASYSELTFEKSFTRMDD
jgi:hypothetical protein